MRLALILCLLAGPLQAWEFFADPVCTLHHAGPEAEVVVTYDPRLAEPYAISVRRAGGAWPRTSPYAIRFEGSQGFTISTNRHRLSPDGATVTASDTGFGNVLSGLENGQRATALLGDRAATVSLADAAPEVRRFRDCTGSVLSLGPARGDGGSRPGAETEVAYASYRGFSGRKVRKTRLRRCTGPR